MILCAWVNVFIPPPPYRKFVLSEKQEIKMRGCLEHIVIVIYNLCRIKDYNARTMMLMTRVLRGNNTLMNFTLFHFLYTLKCMTRIFTFIPFHTSSGLILIHYTLFLPVEDENLEGILFVYGPWKLIQFESLLVEHISRRIEGCYCHKYTSITQSNIHLYSLQGYIQPFQINLISSQYEIANQSQGFECERIKWQFVWVWILFVLRPSIRIQ